ncbi:hypothetical protein HY346_02390 [Candidatus Microgenomates bacterium]|nr:hypothetical protein [Candidatus Microgenomates bacterium]
MAWLVLLALFLIVAFLWGAGTGAPWLPSHRLAVKRGLELLNLKPGQLLVDLGSGSGTVLLLAAQQGIRSIGYEISPVLWLWSWLRTRRYRRLVTIKFGNYWHQPLPVADGIYVFLMERFMPKLDQKLKSELSRPTSVVSFGFKIGARPIVERRFNVYLYRYP